MIPGTDSHALLANTTTFEVDDGVVLCCESSGQLLYLNETAASIFHGLAAGLTRETLVGEISRRTGVGENRLARNSHDQRWGLHLVKVVDGRRHQPERPTAPSDYYAYGEPVLAPAAGEVVQVRDGLPDTAPGELPRDVPGFGNLVVLKVREAEYVFLPHLRAGSILVAEGEAVAAGQELAAVGFSGFSPVTPEPHVALHLQDTPDELMGEAVPWFFAYESAGKTVERGVPKGGMAPDGRLLGELISPVD